MHDCYIIQSVNQLSISFIPGLLADPLVHDPTQIYHLVEQPVTELFPTRVRIQLVFMLPSLPCVPYINTGDNRGLMGVCVPRSNGQDASQLLLEFLQIVYGVLEYLWDILFSLSSSLSSTTPSATSSSSEAEAVTMGAFPLTRGVGSAGSTSSSSCSTSSTYAGLRTI